MFKRLKLPAKVERVAPLSVLVLALALLTACGEERQPPATFLFEGLPVSGSLADAQRAGFTACVSHNVEMRCRKEGVSFRRHGPFSASLDLLGGEGAGGFDHLILWHPSDQSALVTITNELRSEGWSECLTPVGAAWEGQAIYQRQGSPIFIALDLTYWDRRTLKVYRAVQSNIPECREQK